MIRVAGSTFAFGNMNLEDSCAILKEMGFKYADVGACGWSSFKEWVPQQVVKNIDDPDGEADRIRRVTEANGLQIAELFIVDFGEAINHPDQESRKRSREMFTKMAKVAQKAGFKSMMMIPGNVHEDMGQTFEQAFQLSVEQLTAMVNIAEEHGMHCNIEPCIFSVAHHPDNAVRLAKAVPGLGLTVDYAHQVQLDLGHDDIEPLHAYANHFQAKQSAPGEFQAKPDEGVVDFGRVVRKMKQDGFDGVISVEFVSSPEVLEKGWDIRNESARLKEILDEAIAAPV